MEINYTNTQNFPPKNVSYTLQQDQRPLVVTFLRFLRIWLSEPIKLNLKCYFKFNL